MAGGYQGQGAQLHDEPQLSEGLAALAVQVALQSFAPQFSCALVWQLLPSQEMEHGPLDEQVTVRFWQMLACAPAHVTSQLVSSGQVSVAFLHELATVPHLSWQSKPWGHVLVAPVHAVPVQSITHTLLAHPPLQTAGHVPPGGVGD